MANMLADKIADKEIRVIYGIPESTSFGYAEDINNGKKIGGVYGTEKNISNYEFRR